MSPLVAAAVALVPGIHAWWSGRILLTRMDDPAFPELLLARSQRRTMVFSAAGAILAVMASSQWLWTIPLMLLGALVGGFSFRRALFGESWGISDYLRFTLFSVVGAAGFWLLLGFSPRIIVAVVEGWAPPHPLVVAGVLATVVAIGLIVWEAEFPRVWLALHRATPLDRPDLQPRLDDIISRAGVKRPGVFRYGASGAYVMNAIALPSTRQSGVAFGDTLLELLDADEITAVFAHEVAHLEQHDAGVLARIRLVTRVLLLGGAVIAIAALAYLPAHAGLITIVWPLVVIGILLRRISQSQAHESESDRRSAELVGDPEPMIRALTKLHHYSKLPRRWPYDLERSATHPSLARRIQSLRSVARSVAVRVEGEAAPAHAVVEPAAPAEPTIVRSTKAGVWIALDATRIYWFEGVPGSLPPSAAGSTGGAVAGEPMTMTVLRERATSYRANAYSDLAELRVAVSRGGRSITARDRAGTVTVTPLHADDVAAAQRALDLLDGQLATTVRQDWRATGRKVAALAALVLLASRDFGWQWVPLLLALSAPSAWAVAALGTTMVAKALFAALTAVPGEQRWSMVMILTVIVGAAVCWKAWRWMTLPDTLRRRRTVHAALASACALAMAAGKAYENRPASLDWTAGEADVVARFAAAGAGRRVELSPSGRHVAIQSVDPTQRPIPYDYDEEYGGALWQFTIADASSASRVPPRTVLALGLAFLDDRRVLAVRTLASSGDSLEIFTQGVDADSGMGWRRVLPPIARPTLAVDRGAARWTVTGYDRDAGDGVIVSGDIQGDGFTVTHEPYSVIGGLPLQIAADGRLLSATLNTSGGTGRMVLAGIGVIPYSWAISRGGHGARERIGSVPGNPECGTHGGPAVLCVVTGERGPSLWRIDDEDTLTPLGMLPGTFDLWRASAGDRLVGADRFSGTLAVVDVEAGRARRMEVADSAPAGVGFVVDVAAASDLVAALRTTSSRSEVTLYRVR